MVITSRAAANWHQPYTEPEVHLWPTSGTQVAAVEHVAPADCPQELGDHGPGVCVVADTKMAWSPARDRRLNPGEVRCSDSSPAHPIAILAHDGEPSRSIGRHCGVVCGRCQDGDRACTAMGESRARAQHGIAPVAVPPMSGRGADRLREVPHLPTPANHPVAAAGWSRRRSHDPLRCASVQGETNYARARTP